MKNTFNDNSLLSIDGHVIIKDPDSGEVLLDKHNAINFENMTVAIANLLANQYSGSNSYFITRLDYGNGGTFIDGVGLVSYRSPLVNGESGSLYNKTYEKFVNTTDPDNTITVTPYASNSYTDITITATLNWDEPSTQSLTDTSSGDGDTDFIFDEIAIATEAGLNLTHLIFHPIEKSANRRIQIVYTIRIRAGN